MSESFRRCKLQTNLLTLLTDFGISSLYVAQLHGVIYSRQRDMKVIDISHSVPPQNIHWGACVLADCLPWFPKNTVHLAVVDPGVGTSRPVIAARFEWGTVIAPDNGLITLAAEKFSLLEIVQLRIIPGLHGNITPTFHARDFMAPLAVAICQGMSLAEAGSPTDDWVRLYGIAPTVTNDSIRAQVIMIDGFGNLITNVTHQHLSALAHVKSVRCGSQIITRMVTTYGEASPGELVGLFGSSDRFELAVVNGNAAQRLGACVGTELFLGINGFTDVG